MDRIGAGAALRVARPSADLARAERFWVDGVGLEVIWRADGAAADEHALLMVGAPGAAWHLEIVGDSEAADAARPHAEELVVLYLGDPPDPAWLARIEECGGRRTAARNPYWDRWGTTIVDPDGYHLVLSTRTWEP